MRYNPFVPFQYSMFAGFEKKGQVFFVQQTFDRARDHFAGASGYYLLSHYEHLAHAQTHESAVRKDPSARLYCWNNEDDRKALQTLLSPGSNNHVYAALIADPRWAEKARRLFMPAIHQWIHENTRWKISVSVLPIKFNMIFGELFFSIRWGQEERRVKLKHLENFIVNVNK